MRKEALEATVFLGLAQLSTLVESTDEIENWTVSMAISYPVTRTQLTPRFRRVLHRSVGVYVQYGSMRTRRALWYFSFLSHRRTVHKPSQYAAGLRLLRFVVLEDLHGTTWFDSRWLGRQPQLRFSVKGGEGFDNTRVV